MPYALRLTAYALCVSPPCALRITHTRTQTKQHTQTNTFDNIRRPSRDHQAVEGQITTLSLQPYSPCNLHDCSLCTAFEYGDCCIEWLKLVRLQGCCNKPSHPGIHPSAHQASHIQNRKSEATLRTQTHYHKSCHTYRVGGMSRKALKFPRFPPSCSANRSPGLPESAIFEISHVLFCAQESQNS